MDNGSEFKRAFKPLLQTYGIKAKRISVKNPQANAILERIHQVIQDMLRTHALEDYDFNMDDPWSDILASVAWAVRSTVHTTLNATPGQLVFGRDMIFHDTYLANWQLIHSRKEKEMKRSNTKENKVRIAYEYSPGTYAYIVNKDLQRKLKAPNEGPYKILEAFTNGILKLQLGTEAEIINIRRLTPIKDAPQR